MPVNRCFFWQPVGHEYTHTIALDDFDRRAGTLTVVAPHVDFEARRHFAHNRFSHQMKFLNTFVHAIRKRPAIERDDGAVSSLRAFRFGTAPWRGGACAGLINRLGYAGQRVFANSCGCHGTRQTDERTVDKVSAFHLVSMAFAWGDIVFRAAGAAAGTCVGGAR